MGTFELLGDPTDETRMIVHREAGYSIPIPGHPKLVDPPRGPPVYGALVAMSDLPIALGFRLDTLPSSVEPQALAIALATTYGKSRAGRPVAIEPMIGSYLPRGATAGARCVYSLAREQADSSDDALEQLEVTLRAAGGIVDAMYYSCRFHVEKVNPFRWAHFRTAVRPHQRWNGPDTTAPALWPASTLARSTVALELTESAFTEAQAKAAALGGLTRAAHDAVVKTLLELNDSNDLPATTPLSPLLATLIPMKIHEAVPPAVSSILLANFGEVKTMHDLRAWLWQQVWAIGNRASILS